MYGKIFDSIFDSSVMEEDVVTRYVWTCLIVLADWDGNVDMTAEAIGRRINVPVQGVHTAIEQLGSPDPRSRSEKDDGRRLVLLDEHRDWGWHLVNHEHYREMRKAEDRRAYYRDYRRERRAAGKDKPAVHSEQVEHVQPFTSPTPTPTPTPTPLTGEEEERQVKTPDGGEAPHPSPVPTGKRLNGQAQRVKDAEDCMFKRRGVEPPPAPIIAKWLSQVDEFELDTIVDNLESNGKLFELKGQNLQAYIAGCIKHKDDPSSARRRR
jgi:hypothetical protein